MSDDGFSDDVAMLIEEVAGMSETEVGELDRLGFDRAGDGGRGI